MPKTIYDPHQGRTVENLEVITVPPPLREKARVLHNLMQGGSTSVGLSRDSLHVTGLYGLRVEDGSYGAGTIGYMQVDTSPVSRFYHDLTRRMVIKAGAIEEHIDCEPATRAAAVLIYTAIRDHPAVQSVCVRPEVELPVNEFSSLSEGVCAIDALEDELVARYPWLEDASTKTYY